MNHLTIPAGRRLSFRPSSPDFCNAALSTMAFVIAFVAVSLVASTASAQMSIDELIISSGPSYQDGAFTDFFADPVIFGSQIAAVSLSTQSGAVIDFVEIDVDEFACDEAGIPGAPCENFVSLAAINALGNLTFTISGESGESETIFVPAADWIPGAGQVGFPSITSPPQGVSTLPPGNLFQWAAAPSWVEVIITDMVDVGLDDGIDEAFFFGNTQTSWAPSGVDPAREYAFELSFFDAFFIEDNRTTVGGAPYVFTSGFESFNRKFVPEPTGAAVWACGIGLVAAFARRRSAPPRPRRGAS